MIENIIIPCPFNPEYDCAVCPNLLVNGSRIHEKIAEEAGNNEDTISPDEHWEESVRAHNSRIRQNRRDKLGMEIAGRDAIAHDRRGARSCVRRPNTNVVTGRG